jgi:hypothetical protein
MSSNQSIDTQFDFIIKWIVQTSKQFGLFCVPYIMAAYLYGIDCWQHVCNQINRTVLATYHSFFQDEIYMYEDQLIHYPIIRTSKTAYNLIYGNLAWIYVPYEHAFYNARISSVSKHKLSYIAASVSQLGMHADDTVTSIPLGDMSEWIGDQTIWSDSEHIPFQVLLLAWAYQNKIRIAVNFPNYHITVMDMEGNETTFDVATERPLDLSSRSNSSATEKNIPPPPSPCMSPHIHSSNIDTIDNEDKVEHDDTSTIEYPPNRPKED